MNLRRGLKNMNLRQHMTRRRGGQTRPGNPAVADCVVRDLNQGSPRPRRASKVPRELRELTAPSEWGQDPDRNAPQLRNRP